MKKYIFILLSIIIVLLSGCNNIGEIKNTLNSPQTKQNAMPADNAVNSSDTHKYYTYTNHQSQYKFNVPSNWHIYVYVDEYKNDKLTIFSYKPIQNKHGQNSLSNSVTISTKDTYDPNTLLKDKHVLFIVKVIPKEKYNALKNNKNPLVSYFVGENEDKVLQITFLQEVLVLDVATKQGSQLLKVNKEDIINGFSFPKSEPKPEEENIKIDSSNNKNVKQSQTTSNKKTNTLFIDMQTIKAGDVTARRIVKSVEEDEEAKTIAFLGDFHLNGVLTFGKNNFLFFTPKFIPMVPSTRDNPIIRVEFDNKEDVLAIKEIEDYLKTITPIDDTIINGIDVTISFSNYRYIYDKQNDFYKILAHFNKLISIDE